MLLVIEIWLTVKAWKKGWKGLALLPMGIVFVAAFLVGAALAESGVSVDEMPLWFVLGDLAVIAVLGVMCATAPAKANAPAVAAAEATGHPGVTADPAAPDALPAPAVQS